ncbi:hypothetical protein [Conexibacter sp. CPCC 206217]|nr:hypothetical protein [Conexibacter sp. CPCC 206217]MDO8213070.1 hypothetical protein [Conexibacter sp. CPCC 206217]
MTVKLTFTGGVAAALARQKRVAVTISGTAKYAGKTAPLRLGVTLKR